MTGTQQSHWIEDLPALEALFGTVAETSRRKEVPTIHPVYRRWIEASPFLVLATSGPGGLDASPRGDRAPLVSIEDERTLLLPDRRGNNRIDSLRNLVADPRVGILFLVPGVAEALRVNGRARITVDPALLERFVVNDARPRCVIRVDVETVYFQCARSIVRSQLWTSIPRERPAGVPTPGEILAAVTAGEIGGAAYDADLASRMKTQLY